MIAAHRTSAEEIEAIASKLYDIVVEEIKKENSTSEFCARLMARAITEATLI